MRILVTGATGFIGSHVAQRAMAAGHDVVALARTPAKVPGVFSAFGGPLPEVVEGDATDPAAVRRAVDGCDAVVHAAAIVAMRRSESAAAHHGNTEAGQVVLTAAAEAGCNPIVHVSSVSVFDLAGETTTVDSPLRKAVGGYSRSKTELEVFARGMQAAGSPVTITYPAGVFGPDAPTLTAVHKAAQTWIRTPPVMPAGINLVDVRDLAALHVAILEAGGPPSRYVMGGHYLLWEELYDLINESTGVSPRRIPTSGALIRAMGWVADALRLDPPIDFPLTHEAMVEATKAAPIDSRATLGDLGPVARAIEGTEIFRPLAHTVADTYRWMAKNGHVAKEHVGHLAEP